MVDLTLIQVQHIYSDKFTYLEMSRNMMLSLTDINARLASIRTGITWMQTNVDKINTDLEMQATHTVPLLLLPQSTLKEVLENIKRGMAQHP